MPFAVPVTAAAMLFANSEPGIVGGFADCAGASMFGL
jgi:hypothetical protein